MEGCLTVLKDFPDVVGVRVGLPVGTPDYGVLLIDVMLEQPIPHLVCEPGCLLQEPCTGN